MGSSLPLILHIFSTLFPSPSVFFFHSFLSGPYSLPLPLIFSLPTFFFLPSLFSFSSFLSPYFPPSSPYLLSCLLSFLFLPFPSFCALFFHPCHACLSHASSTPPSLSTLLSSHHFLSQLSFYPSVIHPLPVVSAAFFPYLPYPSLPCCFLLYPKTLPLKAMWVYASSLSSQFHCCCLVTWGYLRITQSLNQLQLILQEVLLFWSREATCEGIADFCPFFPSSPSIPPSSTPSLLSLLPSFPTFLTLAYHAVFFCTPRLFLLKPCECMLVHSLLNSIAAAWWHEAI